MPPLPDMAPSLLAREVGEGTLEPEHLRAAHAMKPPFLAALPTATLMLLPGAAAAQAAPPPAAQNPSPMVEHTRAHERLTPRELGGATRSFPGPAGKPVEVWIPEGAGMAPRGSGAAAPAFDLVVHFHGAAWLPEQAVAALHGGTVAAVVNLGAGSGAYERAFSDPAAFDSVLAGVAREVEAAVAPGGATPAGGAPRIGRLTLVGFSAGYGAVRAILREPRWLDAVDAVLLLDGLHTSYVPEGKPLADGGALDTAGLAVFADFARAAARGDKRFVVTHSEIFPGTFASTTETTDWLLGELGLSRTPVLEWGPRGMQQLSEARSGGFELLGFAGNAAPDHVDHLHAMPEMLKRATGG